MNNRQAGAYRELVRKEERAREKWQEHFGHMLNGNLDGTSSTSTSASTQRTLSIPSSTLQAAGQSITLRPVSPGQAIANHNVYDQAIRISSPRLMDEEDPNVPQTITRKVIRQVEVPYVRQVKVPVKTQQIIPQVVQKKIRTKKLVEVPTYKEVEEQYTEVIQQPALRQKEIWVKKLVPERYMASVEVQKTRKVKVPATEIREVDDYEIVNVTENKAIEVDGYRVDQVKDSKVVEVEEYQTYELRPHATGQSEVVSTRDLGPTNGHHHSRRVGPIYPAYDPSIADIDVDNAPNSSPQRHRRASTSTSTLRQSGINHMHARTSRVGPTRHTTLDQAMTSRASTQPLGITTDATRIGFKVRDGAQNGVLVHHVTQGEAAERAGVHVGDIIMYVCNRPTRTVNEFRSVVSASSGPVLLQVRRRGVPKLLLTVHR